MVTIKIVVEGGVLPDGNEDAATFDNSENFRESFHILLSGIFPPASINLEIETGASYTSSIKSFKKQLQSNHCILLIDSDCPPIEKFRKLKELALVEYADHVFFMVQEMESWILSQPSCILKTYINYPYNGSLDRDEIFGEAPETISKPSIKLHEILGRYFYEMNGIKKKKYGKLKDGPLLIANLNIAELIDTFEDVNRLNGYTENN